MFFKNINYAMMYSAYLSISCTQVKKYTESQVSYLYTISIVKNIRIDF